MIPTLVISISFVIHLHAAIVTSVNTSPNTASVGNSPVIADAAVSYSSADIEQQLANISTSCLSRSDTEQIAGGFLRYTMAEALNAILVNQAQEVIGLEELRAVAGFAPPGPWTAFRRPSSDEINAAPTIEKYYELREPRTMARSLDSAHFFESNFPPAISFLDSRFPAIRAIYRRRFEDVCRNRPDTQKKIGKKEVDEMISVYRKIASGFREALSQLLANIDCV